MNKIIEIKLLPTGKIEWNKGEILDIGSGHYIISDYKMETTIDNWQPQC